MRHIAIQRLVSEIRNGLSARGLSVRGAERRARLPQRAIQSVLDGHDPHLSRAADILAALGYELVIRPRGGPAAEAEAAPDAPSPAPGTGPGAGGSTARSTASPAPAFEPVPDRRIAEALAVLADEYEALNARGRESLLMRFWAAHPDLRERALHHAGRRLARLAGGGG